MTARQNEVYDVVGVGFGPSNMSLAIALEEQRVDASETKASSVFFERQRQFGWHRNMLLPSTTMQISFLKDLATFRNPLSRFSFINFLHESDRLVQFVNNQDFFPKRHEFHQYLEWAAAHFKDRVAYDAEVTAIGPGRWPTEAGPLDRLELEVRVSGEPQVVCARNVVISTGLVPRLPEGVERGEQVWHSSEFLERYRGTIPDELKAVAVVGAGQSAAEITRFLYDALPHATIYAVIPSYGYSVADDTPFANQVFDPGAVDDYYFGSERTREAFWSYHKNTNYSVVDDEVIRALYQRSYDDEVRGTKRLHFLNLSRVQHVKPARDVVRVALASLVDGNVPELDVDALVLATGYDAMEPTRLLGDLERYCLRDETGRFRVTRDYRLLTTSEVTCGIYLQGGTEHTHGLTSPLLSNIAIRSGEIAESIVARRADRSAPTARIPAAVERVGGLSAAAAGKD